MKTSIDRSRRKGMKRTTSIVSLFVLVLLILSCLPVSESLASRNRFSTNSTPFTEPSSDDDVRMCLELEQRPDAAALPPGVQALTFKNNARWWGKNVLTVTFMGGDDYLRSEVRKYAAEWSKFGNIRFQFIDSSPADIRVAFEENNSSWSAIGIEARNRPQNLPTMNFGWLRTQTTAEDHRSVIEHEFGHALGFIHEHQHPLADIPWNKPAAYAYYQKAQNWTASQVDFNVFQKFSVGETTFAAYDPTSIMHYAIPPSILLDPRRAVGWNTDLSATDKEFVGKMYPGEVRPRHRILYGSGAMQWTVADRLVGKDIQDYKLIMSGEFRGSEGDEVILVNPTTGSNLILYREGVNDWKVLNNVMPPLAVNGYDMAVSYDFNGDGRSDIFFVNSDGDNRLMLQNSNGGFVNKGAISGKTAVNGYDKVVAGDFNGDGRGDLFFLNIAGDNRRLLQNAQGQFTVASEIAGKLAVNNYSQVIAFDADGNGLTDLFFLNVQGENRLLRQTSSGKFEMFGADGQIAGPKAVNGYNYVVASDFNADGKADLLFLNRQTGDNRLIFQSANGSFDKIFSLIGNKAVNNYTLVTAGRFDSSTSGLDLYLFE